MNISRLKITMFLAIKREIQERVVCLDIKERNIPHFRGDLFVKGII